MTNKKSFKVEAINPVFTFWRENKVANEFKLLASEMKPKFLDWLITKEKTWVDYYGSEQVIIAFITDKDGLNSTFDQSQFNEIYKCLRPDFKLHITKDQPLNS